MLIKLDAFTSPKADRLLCLDTQHSGIVSARAIVLPRKKQAKKESDTRRTGRQYRYNSSRAALQYLCLTRQVELLQASGSITAGRQRDGCTAQYYRYGRRRAPGELGRHGSIVGSSRGVGGADIDGNECL